MNARLGRSVRVLGRDKGALTVSSGVRANTAPLDVTTTATLAPDQTTEVGASVVGRTRVYRIPASVFEADVGDGGGGGVFPDNDDLVYDPPSGAASLKWRIVAVRRSADQRSVDLETERSR